MQQHNFVVISIHTFLAEGDGKTDVSNCKNFISIHTFLAEGDEIVPRMFHHWLISIHTFLAEGDGHSCFQCFEIALFQSTPSSRKVTQCVLIVPVVIHISIHTFLAEGDCKNIYNYFFIMHIFMHYILSYL